MKIYVTRERDDTLPSFMLSFFVDWPIPARPVVSNLSIAWVLKLEGVEVLQGAMAQQGILFGRASH